MPGGLTARGCEACRRAKKGCDLKKPTCSRCERLLLRCVGNGAQRYKFMTPKVLVVQDCETAIVPAPKVAPGNENTKLAMELVAILGTQEVRYDSSIDLFSMQLPGRIGSNPALDAGVAAYVAAHNSLHNKGMRPKAVRLYVKAMEALRKSFADSTQASSSDHMYAISLTRACKEWVGGPILARINHGEILLHLLRDAYAQGRISEIEPESFLAFLTLPIVESFWNPKIELGPWFWELYETVQPSAASPSESRHLITTTEGRTLARVAVYLREPQKYIFEIRLAYRILCSEHAQIRTDFFNVMTAAKIPATPYFVKRIFLSYILSYAMFLAMGCILNRILQIYDDEKDYRQEACDFCDKVIALANEAMPYRPMATLMIPAALVTAWAATTDFDRLSIVKELALDYQADFDGIEHLHQAWQIRRILDGLEQSRNKEQTLGVGAVEHGINKADADIMESIGECVIL